MRNLDEKQHGIRRDERSVLGAGQPSRQQDVDQQIRAGKQCLVDDGPSALGAKPKSPAPSDWAGTLGCSVSLR